MLSPNPDLEISELCHRVGLPVRTVRYYIQEGLLPPTQREGAGRGPRYGELHVATLRAIRELQRQGLTLEAIRERLATLDQRGLARLASLDEKQGTLPDAEHSPDTVTAFSMKASARILQERVVSSKRTDPPQEPSRSHWERIEISPDIELHVRRPLAPFWNKRLDALLQVARRLFRGMTK